MLDGLPEMGCEGWGLWHALDGRVALTPMVEDDSAQAALFERASGLTVERMGWETLQATDGSVWTAGESGLTREQVREAAREEVSRG